MKQTKRGGLEELMKGGEERVLLLGKVSSWTEVRKEARKLSKKERKRKEEEEPNTSIFFFFLHG